MYEIQLLSFVSLAFLKFLPYSYKKYSTSFPLIFYIICISVQEINSILSRTEDPYTVESVLLLSKPLFYTDSHSICINFICWLQLVPYFYYSPELTYNFQEFNLVQINYSAFLLFELEGKDKFYFLMNFIMLLWIQYKNEIISYQELYMKSIEFIIEYAILYFTYDLGYTFTMGFIIKNIVLPFSTQVIAIFLDFFTFIYYFETLVDYKNYEFPNDSRLNLGKKVCKKGKNAISPLDIFSHAYFFPFVFLIIINLVSDISPAILVHILIMMSIPLSFKLCLITKNYDRKSLIQNSVSIFFSMALISPLIA